MRYVWPFLATQTLKKKKENFRGLWRGRIPWAAVLAEVLTLSQRPPGLNRVVRSQHGGDSEKWWLPNTGLSRCNLHRSRAHLSVNRTTSYTHQQIFILVSSSSYRDSSGMPSVSCIGIAKEFLTEGFTKSAVEGINEDEHREYSALLRSYWSFRSKPGMHKAAGRASPQDL